jgi:hypothetical protein
MPDDMATYVADVDGATAPMLRPGAGFFATHG